MTEQPAIPNPSATRSSTGLDPNVAATLAYLGWWVTGIVFFVLERDSRYVRFHAMQAILAFGAFSAIGACLVLAGLVTLFVSSAGFRMLMAVAQLFLLAGFIVWVICLAKAYGGERVKLPLAGALAERIANRS